MENNSGFIVNKYMEVEMDRNERLKQSLCILYDGAVVEVDSLKEGMKLADEMVSENGSDITIVQNEEVVARREWFAESDHDQPFGDPMEAELDPIEFEGYGFYSDWLIDDNYREMNNLLKTFGELLNSNKEIDCELIIGNVEMPASFVWNEKSRITPYGYDYFKPLMECSYELLENGNITIDDGDEAMGEKFTWACAGYISESESKKMFIEIELDEKEHNCSENQSDQDSEDEWEPEM
ncbi:hypothetical protein [Acetobacterium bakii]|nr:hypothetical protein [Acetobacterium bakii]